MALAVTLAASPPAAKKSARAVAICSADRALRQRLVAALDADANLAVMGTVGDAAALALLFERARVDIALVDAPATDRLMELTRTYPATAFVAIVDPAPHDGAVDALRAGAHALLSRAADDADVALTVRAIGRGLAVVPTDALAALRPATLPDAVTRSVIAGEAALTARELEVLAAMADGASNKAIARRLGISFHTAKFHVAAILAKLDADSRTEAVTKGAQRGLVML